jgi:hypothetical protein
VQSIETLQQRLEAVGISSVVISGVAVAVWGEPRVTRDVDLKVLLGRDDAERLLTALAPGYVSLLPDPRRALRQQAMLFVQDTAGTRLRDHEDAQGIARRQGDNLDDEYVLDWLRQFEQALDDSTLVAEYKRLREL